MVETSVNICNNSSADPVNFLRWGEGVMLQTRMGPTKLLDCLLYSHSL